ncbi:amino acid adenylation domain-containing protein [Methylovulum psychrotolerans]|uniref:non-ribosomal peptide synthetase n=1 Tax=Methylovulum psychrotolerans TaxID=1704499 RepID=UPI001BFF2EB3|nr:non-ribosomal peptide synthetase [Methylovulum psychrotolerans]MBT9099799.1 amino acid adenylation domain-containing protein [Methylovulum psychrotolerans]
MKNETQLSEPKLGLSAAKQALLQKRLQAKPIPHQSGQAAISKRPIGQSPLSFSQQQLFFLDQLEADSSAYNFSIAVRLKGTLNVPVLEKAINEIIRRHEALRTQFVTIGIEPIQQVLPELRVSVTVEDLCGLDNQVGQLFNQESAMPFNLAQCPLLRVRLFLMADVRPDQQEFVLMITMPHIITDGWSAAVLYRELATLYEAYVQGWPSPLPELAIQYPDFSYWQRQQLQPDVLAKMFAFWQRHLSGLDTDFELPTDRVRSAVQTYNGSDHHFFLAQGLTENLRQLCRKRNVTLFALLFSAFNVLLHRYVGERHICVGTPVANRGSEDIEALIGFFVNVLALHTDLSGNPTFTALVDRTQATMLDAQPYQEYPFELLVKQLKLARNPSFNPLFQVMFVLHNVPFGSIRVTGLEITPFPIENTISKFDLTLHVTEEHDQLHAAFEYNVDLFDADTMARMGEHFRALLEHIADAPETRISELRLSVPQENRQLSPKWQDVEYIPENESPWQITEGDVVHSLFEKQACRIPSAIALSASGLTLTYAELNAKANQLAHYLLDKGLNPGALVALCFGRSWEMVVGILAVLKAGGAYLPIDPQYPKNEIKYLLEDSGTALILSKTSVLPVLPDIAVPISCIDSDWDMIFGYSATNPVLAIPSGNLAYVIYTSGSTGQPKGVAISHRNLWCSTLARFAYYPGQVASFLLLSSFSFDSSVAGLFWTLCQGGKLCIPSDTHHTDPTFLVAWIRQEKISHLLCLPSFYNVLLEQADAGQLKSLQAVIVAGEACLAKVAAYHYAQLPATTLYNEYGPTEGTVWCTVYQIPTTIADGSIPIGHAIPGVRIYILDTYFNPVPVGVPGEVYIGGEGVAIGYLNQSAWTAERFIPNPFDQVVGTRLYRTGDRARYCTDGNILFLGRADQQIKLRGFRVELSEIEAKLRKHSAIKTAVVLHAETASGSQRLIAYLTVKPEQIQTDTNSLRTFLHDHLPDYMVPSTFVFLDSLPTTSNGKLDRKALLKMVIDEQPEGQYCPPNTPTEETLCVIWAQLLGLEKVGIRDNFFELGGDSILSMQMVNRAKQVNLTVKPRQILECQTIEALAKVIGYANAVQADQGVITGEVPLTPIQRWFFAQAYTNPNHWNQAVLLDVKQPINPTLLAGVVQRLLGQHDVLRGHFYQDDGVWQQLLPETADSACEIISADLSSLAGNGWQAALAEQATHWQCSLNLSHGPMVRVVCFDCGQDVGSRLLVIVHHLVMDGVSWRILLEDMGVLYQQALDGKKMVLPDKSSPFKLWAERLSAYAQTALAERNVNYWLNTDWARANHILPTDIADGLDSEATSETLSVTLSSATTSLLLQNAPLIHGVRINEVLLAAVVTVLAEWTQNNAVLLEMEGHGREQLFDDVDISRTVGWFTTLFPVLFEFSADQRFPALVQALQKQLAIIPNHGLDYGVVRYLGKNPELTKRLEAIPTPQFGFNYLGRIDQGNGANPQFSLVQAPVGHLKDPAAQRTHKLNIDASVIADALHIDWSYSSACYRPDTIEELANTVLNILEDFATACPAVALPDNTLVADCVEKSPAPLDLRAEATLAADIAPNFNIGASYAPSRNILLTGVTGFVGAFLLDELLTHTQGLIYCLVRSDTVQDAAIRIEATLNCYGINNPWVKHRVVPLSGDLAKPLLGLPETQFRKLGKTIDVIYHNGSSTNLLLPFQALKAANVSGTREILRLACLGKPKPVHYISTLSIFEDDTATLPPGFSEDDLPSLKTKLTMGYAQSKLVAEHLLRVASGRGLSVSVYRLGAVTGHSRTGAWNIGDFHCRFLKVCLDLGMFPANKAGFMLMPIDFVSHAIIGLANSDAAPGRTYHICNPNATPMDELITWLDRYGYPTVKVPPSEWIYAFHALTSQLQHSTSQTIAGMVEPFVEHHHDNAVPYQNGQTTQALAGIGIALPTIDEGVFGKSLDYMIDSGFLEPPTVSLCQGKVPSTAKSHGIMTRP